MTTPITAPNASSARADLTRTVASGFTPASLTSLLGWWDASNAGSITAAGGFCSQINDLSGNGKHLTQGTGANQPATGTRTLGPGSRNVLDFDGTNDVLQNLAFTLTGQNASVCWIGIVDAATNDRLVSIGDGTNPDYNIDGTWAPLSTDATNFYDYHGNVQREHVARAIGAATIVIVTKAGTVGAIYKNNAAGTVDAAHAAGAFAGSRLAVMAAWSTGTAFGSYSNGAMGELIITGAAFTTTERNNLNTYAQGKWGTP